ncbi:MAG: response regulator [Candidatus Omnitrophica bacterium]|nr:response regulator [Candidatus Omnitrophota bacterium]
MAQLLIVDDELDVREFAANFFRKRKIDVATAASGEEALSMIATDKPYLVLLDIKMSGIDGIETLRRIKNLDQDIKVVMVTGRKPEEEGCVQCQELGASDYIHKPLILEELERVVLRILQEEKVKS